MRMRVIRDYTYGGGAPIELLAGDRVTLGERTDPDGDNPNWIRCLSHRTGVTGWVAADVLSVADGVGVAVCDYSAKEIAVLAGDVVEAARELNGWYWCVREGDCEEGWVEKTNLEGLV